MRKDESMNIAKSTEVEMPLSDVQFLYGKIEELRKQNEELKNHNTHLLSEIENDSKFEIFLVTVIDDLRWYLEGEKYAKTRKIQQEKNAEAEETYKHHMESNIEFTKRFNKIRHDYV